ncbi:mucin-binding protein, partial [Streptococcus cristatus]|uniref:mucin-binding protein n=1 Tax=Streptococcus cristatus TaxID=45634 RepID=UPI0007767241
MDKNARRRLNRASAEKRLRYSVRKFNVGVASVAVAAFMFFGGNVVSADTLAKTDSSSTSTEKTTSVPDSGEDSGTNDSDSESAIEKNSTVATVAESNAVSSVASTASSTSAEDLSSKVEEKTVKSEVASKSEAALKEASSQVSKASVATSQSTAATQSEARVSPAISATAESTAVSSEAATESTAALEPAKVSVEKAASQAASLATASQAANAVAKSEANSTLAAAQSEVNKGYADFRKSGESGFRSFDPQTGKTTVTKENFLDYFRLNGSATYNQSDGIVTLTPDENSKTGNFSLKSKINMNQSFKLTGWVNLGDKTQERYGADGIGFAFHTGNTTDLGADGGNLGIGGLRNATGFKLDTFWNVHTPPKGNRFDTSNTDSFQYGWAEDPRLGQFGAWVNTSFKKVKGQGWLAGEYERWWAETDASSAQRLDSSDLDGRFHDFAIQYDGVTKELTVAYRSNLGVKQWKKKVSSPEELMSMVVTATTGNYKNLQQFKIKRFDFYQSASVDVRYVDEQGREIAEGSVTYPQGAYKGKSYTTEQKKIPGYGFLRMGNGSLPPSGTLADWGTNGTVTYVYRKGADDVKTERKTVTRTIEYRYRDGVTSGRPALPQTVTQTAEFTRTVTGGQAGAWSPASQSFTTVNTPSITGFTPDKTRVDATTVNATSNPGTVVVYYDKDAPTVTTEKSTVTRTINYKYKDGVTSGRPSLPRPITQTVEFTRRVEIDKTTGKRTEGEWTPSRQQLAEVGTPTITGFTPDQDKVPMRYVFEGDGPYNVTVSYSKNDPKVTTETKDVTRTIAYEYEDGVTAGRPALPQPVEQTVQFTRQVSEDPVTGQKTYGNWTPSRQNVAAVDSPEVAGFTPNKPRVNSASVAPTDPSWREIVSYSAATQKGSIVYRTDGKNGVEAKTLYTDNVTGNSNTPVNYTTTAKINEFKQLGYDLVSDGFTKAGGQRFDSNNNVDQTWEVVLTPRIETKQETKDVTRNVRYQYKDGVTTGRPALPRPVTQTTTFTRPVSVNKVTGVETPGQWDKQSEELPKVDSPAVTGFTPDKPSVPASTVTPTSPNEDEVVSYSQDDQRGIIEYVTDGQNGVPAKTLYTDGVTGKSGEDVVYSTANRITQLQQAGYKLVSDGFTQPNGQKFDNDKTKDQVWKVVVTPVIETKQEKKDVTRTIQYQYGDGVTAGRPALPKTVTQTTSFTRPVSVNKVTGVETPGAWDKPNANLPEVNTPAITGYSPDKPKVPGVTVDPTTGDSVEVINYNLDEQRGSIKYVTDGKNGVPVKTLYTDSVAGKSGEPVAYSTVNRLTQLQQAGYKLVSDGFTQPNGQKFDNDKTKDQTWTVVVTPRLDDNTNPADLNSKVTRTIKYQYADGQTAGRPALKAPVTQEATFTRTGKINAVTGEKTFTAWTPATKELAQEATPVVTGFVADKANVAAKTVKAGDANSEEVVQYKKLGSYVPNVPDGLPKVPNLPYPNDPTDPTKPGTDLPVVPNVPGTTPVGPDGTTPLTPKDPSDPSKGYNPPPIPSDPTQDTPINYVKDGQKAIITFVDQDDNNKEVGKVVESGKSGEPIGTTNYATRLKELTDKGYEVVNDEFKGPKTFDNDDKKDQQFVVTLRHGKEAIKDPAELNKKVTRTIKYEYADGQTAGRPALKAPVTQEAAFSRTGERDRVTDKKTYGAWTPATKELAQEATPVVTGFVADKANVAAKTVTPDDKDSEEVVQYKKLGSYVPNVPDGLPKVPNLPYPNDPTDPSKPGTDLPVVPDVPGTTPVGPDGTTPLTPKDPSDPSKGYNPPPIPSDPTQDTPINYVKDGQKAIITFVDQDDNNKEVGKVVESGKSGEPIGTTNYATRLKELTDKG